MRRTAAVARFVARFRVEVETDASPGPPSPVRQRGRSAPGRPRWARDEAESATRGSRGACGRRVECSGVAPPAPRPRAVPRPGESVDKGRLAPDAAPGGRWQRGGPARRRRSGSLAAPCVPGVNRQRKCPTIKQRKCPTPEWVGPGGGREDRGEFSPRSGGANGGAGGASAARREPVGGSPGRAGRAASEGGPEGRLRKPPDPPERQAPGPGGAPEPTRQVEGQTDPLHGPVSSPAFAGSGRGRNTLVRSARCRSR